jgi:hypothetical protein
VVKAQGGQACFECHSDRTCSNCHRGGAEDISADRALLVPSPTVGPTSSP